MKALLVILSLLVMGGCSHTPQNGFKVEAETIRYSKFLSRYLKSYPDSIVKTESSDSVFVYSNLDQSTLLDHVEKANMQYFKVYVIKRPGRRIHPQRPYHFPQVTYKAMSEYPLSCLTPTSELVPGCYTIHQQ